MLLRDRRTVMVSIVLPLFITPLLMFGSRWVQERRERSLETVVLRYAVVGSDSTLARRLIAEMVQARSDTARAPLLLEERPGADPGGRLAAGEIDFYVEALSAEEAARLDTTATLKRDSVAVPLLVLHYREDRDRSERGAARTRAGLRDIRREHQRALLESAGLAPLIDLASVEERDLSDARDVTGLHLGRYVVVFVMMFMLSGGSVVAVDALAGEKERGTLETLLTTAASRADIIAAKHLVILTVALLVAVIQSLNFLAYVALRILPLPQGFVLDVPPLATALLFVLLVPIAALVSGVLLLTSGYARSYKEAQLYFFPVLLLGMVPASAPFLPMASLRSAAVLVPIANVALAVKEVLVGRYDWPFIIIAWVVTAAAAWYVRRLAERVLSTERLIVPTLGEGGLVSNETLFSRRVVPAFAIMWAALFVFASHSEGTADLRVVLLVNLVVVFVGGSLLMIRMHHLSAREVFALRPVNPLVWPLVLVGAPAGLLAAVGVFRLASLVLPVPADVLDAFGKGLMPDEIPFWQVLIFVTVLPGVCEELAFRGALLYGLRRSLRPIPLVLAVGAIFGLFHMALFRLLPTAFLGVLLAGVVLLTGSIFPAMLWHAVNNAAGVLSSRFARDPSGYALAYDVGGAVVLCVVVAALWRLHAREGRATTPR